MGEKKLSKKELYAIFENCGWYEDRKIDIGEYLPKGYEKLPDGVRAFSEEFLGLDLQYEYEYEYEFLGTFRKSVVKTEVLLLPDFGYDGHLDDSGLRYYSEILGKELYPIGMEGDANVALDAELNMYILELGMGCILLSNDPIDGLRKILINDLYTGVYALVELGEEKWTWKERPGFDD